MKHKRFRSAAFRVLAVFLVPAQAMAAVPIGAPTPGVETPATPASPRRGRVNRTVPRLLPPPSLPVFSPEPTEAELFRARVFAEPLVPSGPSSLAENRALVQALESYLGAVPREDVSSLEAFLVAHPDSVWRVSLTTNLGIVYRRTGYFSKALRAYREAWELGRNHADARARAMADKAVGELGALYSRLGRFEELEGLHGELEGRILTGPAKELVDQSKQALWIMRNRPEVAFRCGPLAVQSILNANRTPTLQQQETVWKSLSTSRGTSLAQMAALGRNVDLTLQMAHRQSGAEILVPALIHWKAGHFGALVRSEKQGSLYLLQDPTFGDETWVSREAIDEEASGFFLVPGGILPPGWRTVDVAEGSTVWGKGVPSGQDPSYQEKEDRGPCCQTGQCGPMASYSYHKMLASLNIVDSPVGYSPPRGPAVRFEAAYNQRDAFQPQIFYYSNLGPKWTFDWLSSLEDDPLNPAQTITLYARGGGQETYIDYDPSTKSYAPHLRSGAVVKRTSEAPITYERRLADGSVEVFSQPDGALAFPRRVFLTEWKDPQGNGLRFLYDQLLRLVAVVDALGQVTTLAHDFPTDPLKITQVTDPFGRSARFDYDDAGRLTSITDVIGITSRFTYDGGDFVSALETPYGMTRFSYGQEGPERWLEIIDPLGGKERLEYQNGHFAPLPIRDPPELVPVGFELGNQQARLDTGLTFFWDKRAMLFAPGDYASAEVTNWMVGSGAQTTGVMRTQKRALENRVWYAYPGVFAGAFELGSSAHPIAMARVLDDGTSQIYGYEHNSKGNKTKDIDPLGRETVYEYDPNELDLVQVKQKNGETYDLIETREFNSNHRPLTVTDAAGQTTTYTYNATGQIKTVTTPERPGIPNEDRTTTYSYDPNGYLSSVTGPNIPQQGQPVTEYTYDSEGRIRTTTTQPDGYVLTFDYDDLDRLTKTTYMDGSYEETTYNRLDPEARRDRLGRWSHTFHDALRRVVLTQDPLGRPVTQEWCNCGSLDKIIDGNGNATTWERDVQGRITREIRADDTDVDLVYEETTSRLKQKTDALNQVTSYAYFLDNNAKQITYANALKPTPNVAYTYDSAYNRLAGMIDGNGPTPTSYTYHPVTIPPSLGATRLANVNGPFSDDTISYTYDELGRVKTRSVNGAANQITYSYDALGRMSQEVNLLGNFAYTYETVTDRPSTMTYPGGQTTTYAYFPNGGDHRLKQIYNRVSAQGATLSKFDYTYDPIGNILTWSQQAGSGTPRVSTLGYDRSDQLTSATITSPNPPVPSRYVYTYDNAGNRTTEQIDDASTGASYNDRNELTMQQPGGALRFRGTVNEPATVTVGGKPAEVRPLPSPAPPGTHEFVGSATVTSGTNTLDVVATDPNNNIKTNTYEVDQGGSSKTFTYDANGNLTGDSVKTFEWDAQNRLYAVQQGTHRSEFTYDGLSRRTRIIEKNGANVLSDNQYLWCNLGICEQRNAAGATVTKRYFAYGVQEGTPKYGYTRDHLGSVREMTDGTGAVRARYSYDSYGRRTKVTGDKDADFGYTGYFAHASDLALAPYRAYDSSIGRFISEDPIGLAGGPNMYSYVRNNPLRFSDPYGLRIRCNVSLTYEFDVERTRCDNPTKGGCTHASVPRFTPPPCERDPKCGKWKFDANFDLNILVQFSKDPQSDSSDTPGTTLGEHEGLHVGDWLQWCDSIDSRYPSEGFSTLGECNEARRTFTRRFKHDFLDELKRTGGRDAP